MIKFIVKDDELDYQGNKVGNFNYEMELSSDADVYAVFDAWIAVMRVAGFQQETIDKAINEYAGIPDDKLD